ncbi:glycine zipper 2TM domain-containing protein [bacterium]|nr:glycine zipper 2TM domain-containing protein [bacterium]MBU1957419.1 glycine zipper 2TM domain-containing protein [bacterium]
MKKILISSALAVTLISTMGCAPRGYESATVGQQMTVETGVVQSVKSVVINSQGVGNTLGGIVGAVAGGVAGNEVGAGTGRVVATVLGTAVGGALGGTVGDKLDTNYGQEVIVQLNSGRTVATVLRINESTPALGVGQAVNVFFSGSQISNITAR